jgi:hypothetical protein
MWSLKSGEIRKNEICMCIKANMKIKQPERQHYNVYKTIGFSEYHTNVLFESCSGEVYLIQHYVTKFISDLRQVGGFQLPVQSAYHHWSCEFVPCSWQGVLDTTLCDKVCQWFAIGRWFSPGTPVSSTNKTDCHDILKYCWKWH